MKSTLVLFTRCNSYFMTGLKAKATNFRSGTGGIDEVPPACMITLFTTHEHL
jgi:hypothetical protein